MPRVTGPCCDCREAVALSDSLRPNVSGLMARRCRLAVVAWLLSCSSAVAFAPFSTLLVRPPLARVRACAAARAASRGRERAAQCAWGASRLAPTRACRADAPAAGLRDRASRPGRRARCWGSAASAMGCVGRLAEEDAAACARRSRTLARQRTGRQRHSAQPQHGARRRSSTLASPLRPRKRSWPRDGG